jgi:hypothetical protein
MRIPPPDNRCFERHRRLISLVLAALFLVALAAPGATAKPREGVLRVSADPYSDAAAQHATEVEPTASRRTRPW